MVKPIEVPRSASVSAICLASRVFVPRRMSAVVAALMGTPSGSFSPEAGMVTWTWMVGGRWSWRDGCGRRGRRHGLHDDAILDPQVRLGHSFHIGGGDSRNLLGVGVDPVRIVIEDRVVGQLLGAGKGTFAQIDRLPPRAC